jgi:hypothetical protein
MPTSYQVKLPPPTDWQELQRMTSDMYKRLWANEDIHEFGSFGQRQNGVDIFGFIGQSKKVGGVQCKCVVSLTPEEVEEEYKSSQGFTPHLSKYVIVTTSKRDTRVQKKSLELTQSGSHICTVVFWEDFCQRLSEQRDVLRKYYSDFILYDIDGDSPGKLIRIDIDVNHYEILVSRLHPEDKHYGGTILVSDLQSRKCITYRTGDHWSRLAGIVGITKCDAFLVSAWLNSFADISELLKLGHTTLTYDLSHEEWDWAEKEGFLLWSKKKNEITAEEGGETR